MEHDAFCNCEDCWWARDCKVVCTVCGSIHEEDQSHNDRDKKMDKISFEFVMDQTEIDTEDSGAAKIFTTEGSGEEMFFRIQSWDEEGIHKELKHFINKKCRLTLEICKEEDNGLQ